MVKFRRQNTWQITFKCKALTSFGKRTEYQFPDGNFDNAWKSAIFKIHTWLRGFYRLNTFPKTCLRYPFRIIVFDREYDTGETKSSCREFIWALKAEHCHLTIVLLHVKRIVSHDILQSVDRVVGITFQEIEKGKNWSLMMRLVFLRMGKCYCWRFSLISGKSLFDYIQFLNCHLK